MGLQRGAGASEDRGWSRSCHILVFCSCPARVFRARIWWDLKVQCLLLGSAYTARRGLGSQHHVLGAPPRHPFFQSSPPPTRSTVSSECHRLVTKLECMAFRGTFKIQIIYHPMLCRLFTILIHSGKSLPTSVKRNHNLINSQSRELALSCN